jgi:CxxC-x17-CxxC domain-containing protein
MEPEIKSCQNCKKDFTIETEDFNYYEKIKVPAPTWCSECRMTRRLSCANSWSLFWRNCNKCEKRTLSMFPPEKDLAVYCQVCWWADDWDGTEYAMDYDPSRPFFQQLKELSDKAPYASLESTYTTLKNCEYTNSIAYSKNCFMVIWADYAEWVYYSSIINGLKSSSDCLRGWESELCYESIGFNGGYQVFFSEEFNDCVDMWFSRNCYGCTNCIGCVNLRGAKNCIFNVQYSKEEYQEKLKEMSLDTWSGIQKVKEEADKFWASKPYRESHGNSFNLNTTGEYVYFSKNSKECFILNYAENCKFTQMVTVEGTKDCMDYTGWGNKAELLYECLQIGEGASNCKFSAYCFPDALNDEHCLWAMGGKNNFGCVNLKRKQYCILNKQYSKEEYEKLRKEIVEDIKKNPYIDDKGRVWSYGDFFSPAFGKFAYNNSNAMKFLPKTREEAERLGYSWHENENPKIQPTMKSTSLSETISEVEDGILKEIIECGSCSRPYKIVQGEIDLLRKMNLPLPHDCPKCREDKRFARENKPGMYHRKCAKCAEDIYTPYSPDTPRIVYCVKCYQQEFI